MDRAAATVRPPATAAATADLTDTIPTADEVRRIERRRRLAKKTPAQRRLLTQYHRRHNERDGRLVYCDYCDLFISSKQKTWATHLKSIRHLASFQAYYDLLQNVESGWMAEIEHGIEVACSQAVIRAQQQVAGHGAATPLPPQAIAHGIVVGGLPNAAPPPFAKPPLPSIKIGSTLVTPLSPPRPAPSRAAETNHSADK